MQDESTNEKGASSLGAKGLAAVGLVSAVAAAVVWLASYFFVAWPVAQRIVMEDEAYARLRDRVVELERQQVSWASVAEEAQSGIGRLMTDTVTADAARARLRDRVVELERQQVLWASVADEAQSGILTLRLEQLGSALVAGEPFEALWSTVEGIRDLDGPISLMLDKLRPFATRGVPTVEMLREELERLRDEQAGPGNSPNPLVVIDRTTTIVVRQAVDFIRQGRKFVGESVIARVWPSLGTAILPDEDRTRSGQLLNVYARAIRSLESGRPVDVGTEIRRALGAVHPAAIEDWLKAADARNVADRAITALTDLAANPDLKSR